MSKHTVIQHDFHKGRQSLELRRIVDTGEHKLRTFIDRDSYDEQSSAVVQVWTPNGWTEVVRREIEFLSAVHHKYVTRDLERAENSFTEDALKLEATALRVLA